MAKINYSAEQVVPEFWKQYGPGFGSPHNPSTVDSASALWEFLQECRAALNLRDTTDLYYPFGDRLSIHFQKGIIEVEKFSGLKLEDHWEISRYVRERNGGIFVVFEAYKTNYQNGEQIPKLKTDPCALKKPAIQIDTLLRRGIIV